MAWFGLRAGLHMVVFFGKRQPWLCTGARLHARRMPVAPKQHPRSLLHVAASVLLPCAPCFLTSAPSRQSANFNVEAAQHGIVYIDEIDKIGE